MCFTKMRGESKAEEDGSQEPGHPREETGERVPRGAFSETAARRRADYQTQHVAQERLSSPQ